MDCIDLNTYPLLMTLIPYAGVLQELFERPRVRGAQVRGHSQGRGYWSSKAASLQTERKGAAMKLVAS